MSSTTQMSVAIAHSGSGEDASDNALRSLAEVVRDVARTVDTMWSQQPADGAVATRLVEASHSLHRAAIALQDDAHIG